MRSFVASTGILKCCAFIVLLLYSSTLLVFSSTKSSAIAGNYLFMKASLYFCYFYWRL